MKAPARLLLSAALVAFCLAALAQRASAQPPCSSPGVLSGDSCTYTYTSVGPTEETLTVPSGVNMTVTAYGAPGGRGEDNSGTLDGTPGGGGMQQGTFSFPIDETLTVLVGEQGAQASAAGEGGGGAGDSAFFGELYQGGKGGGGSYVFADGSPLVIAGGGGGTGSDNSLPAASRAVPAAAPGWHRRPGRADLDRARPRKPGRRRRQSGHESTAAAWAAPRERRYRRPAPQSGQNGKGPVDRPV